MNETERAVMVGRIAADSQGMIARFTKHGAFAFPLTTNTLLREPRHEEEFG